MPPLERSDTIRPPKRPSGLSDKAQARLVRVRMLEHEQEQEDRLALRATREELRILHESFASVKAEFCDLDGLSWDTPAAQEVLMRWHAQQATHVFSHPPGLPVPAHMRAQPKARRSISSVLSPSSSTTDLDLELDLGDDNDDTVRGRPVHTVSLARTVSMHPQDAYEAADLALYDNRRHRLRPLQRAKTLRPTQDSAILNVHPFFDSGLSAPSSSSSRSVSTLLPASQSAPSVDGTASPTPPRLGLKPSPARRALKVRARGHTLTASSSFPLSASASSLTAGTARRPLGDSPTLNQGAFPVPTPGSSAGLGLGGTGCEGQGAHSALRPPRLSTLRMKGVFRTGSSSVRAARGGSLRGAGGSEGQDREEGKEQVAMS